MPHSNRHPSGAKAPNPEPSAVAVYNRRSPRKKAKKPRFPLWLHPTGQWAKKIKGHYFYFGTDKDKALEEYTRVREDLEAGRRPPATDSDRTTLLYLTNAFLTNAKHKVQTGELTTRSFNDYYASCELLLAHLGKTTAVESIRPDDLLSYRQALSKGRNSKARSAITVGNEVNRARVILRFAFENGLVDRPVRFGDFKRPAKKVMRRLRASRGPRTFDPGALRQIIETADVQLKAMILLGVNCGFGNHDVATLPIENLDGQWIDYPRPKTGIERRCPLWPETVAALHAAIETRVRPKDDEYAGLIFITKYRGPWFRDGKPSGAITHEFRRLLDKLNLYRPGLSYYALRHQFQTTADETGDYIATKIIMGHADDSISATYREGFPDERLRKVSDHVRTWLFGYELQADGR